MKTVLLLALLLFLVNSFSYAQHDSYLIAQSSSYTSKPSPLFLPSQAPFQGEWLPPGYRMRKVGATLTLAGAFLVGGGFIVGNTSTLPISPLMVIAGTGMIIPGVIFWTKGAIKYRIYQVEQANTTGSIHLTGNGIVYRFR